MRFSIRKIASLPPVGGAPAFTVQAEEEEQEEEEKKEEEEEELLPQVRKDPARQGPTNWGSQDSWPRNGGLAKSSGSLINTPSASTPLPHTTTNCTD